MQAAREKGIFLKNWVLESEEGKGKEREALMWEENRSAFCTDWSNHPDVELN